MSPHPLFLEPHETPRVASTRDADLFDRIRSACVAVMSEARFVRLLPDAILPAAERLLREAPDPPVYDARFHHRGTPGSTLAFVLTLATINFGSGYFPHLRKRSGHSGYLTVAASLRDRFDRHGPWSADQLAAIEPHELAAILDQDPGTPEVAELLELFARALRDLGELLRDHYAGRFEALVESARGSARALVEALAAMPFYRDVARYGSIEVPFYKRAQLAVSDLALAFEGRGYGAFRDVERLTAFADNLVPHVLRVEGVLVYDGALLARIDAGEPLPAGSPEEVEIRAAAVHAVERLVEALRTRGERVSPHEVDHRLWWRGQRPELKAHARHRTRSVFY